MMRNGEDDYALALWSIEKREREVLENYSASVSNGW